MGRGRAGRERAESPLILEAGRYSLNPELLLFMSYVTLGNFLILLSLSSSTGKEKKKFLLCRLNQIMYANCLLPVRHSVDGNYSMLVNKVEMIWKTF